MRSGSLVGEDTSRHRCGLFTQHRPGDIHQLGRTRRDDGQALVATTRLQRDEAQLPVARPPRPYDECVNDWLERRSPTEQPASSPPPPFPQAFRLANPRLPPRCTYGYRASRPAGLLHKRDVQPKQISLKTLTTVLRPRRSSNGVKEDVEDVRRAGFELVKVIFNSCASKKCRSPSRAQLFTRFVDHDLGDLSSPVR
jgi:hypothetical protein